MLEPIGARLLIKADPPVTQSDGGIVFPDKSQKIPETGIVLAVGDVAGEFEIPIDVGERVLYSKYGCTEFRYKGEDFLLVSVKDILCIVPPEPVEEPKPEEVSLPREFAGGTLIGSFGSRGAERV